MSNRGEVTGDTGGIEKTFLQSLPHDVLIKILDHITPDEQLAFAQADPTLRAAVAETKRSPLRTIDHHPGATLGTIAPAFPCNLPAQTARLLRLAGPHLRVLRIHPATPWFQVHDILQLAFKQCPNITQLAFSDRGAVTPDLFHRMCESMSGLKVLQLAHTIFFTLADAARLPRTVTHLDIFSPTSSIFNGTCENSSRGSDIRIVVHLDLSDNYASMLDFASDFMRIAVQLRENQGTPSIHYVPSIVQMGSVTVSIAELIDACVQKLPRAAGTLVRIGKVHLMELAASVARESSVSPSKHLSLGMFMSSTSLDTTLKQFEAAEHLELDRIDLRIAANTEHDQEDDFLWRVANETRALSQLTVRSALSPSGDETGIKLFWFASRVLEQQPSIRRVNISREMLSKTYMRVLKNFLSACSAVTHLHLCDPQIWNMLDKGRAECFFSELYDIPNFLAIVRKTCPRLKILFVERASENGIPLHNTPREKFAEALQAIEQFKLSRPETDISTLRYQVDEWFDSWNKTQSGNLQSRATKVQEHRPNRLDGNLASELHQKSREKQNKFKMIFNHIIALIVKVLIRFKNSLICS